MNTWRTPLVRLPPLSCFLVLVSAKDHDCLVEGPLDNMQTSLMSFPPPLKGRMDHRRLYFTALAQGTHAGAGSQVHNASGGLGTTRSEASETFLCACLVVCCAAACASGRLEFVGKACSLVD